MGMTASEMRNHLVSLHAERALALIAISSAPEEELAEIDREIGHVQTAYVGTAVTEIATLRGELFGRQVG
jgi:hypothetical protein